MNPAVDQNPPNDDLVIATREGAPLTVSQFRGRVVVIAFLSRANCQTGPSLEVLTGLQFDIGERDLATVVCVVDLEHGERVPDFSPFTMPTGAVPRRQVAEFMGVPMSGFHLPQFLILDRQSRHRLTCVPSRQRSPEAIVNMRLFIERLVEEPESALEAAAAAALARIRA